VVEVGQATREQTLDLITESEIVIGGLQPRVNYTFAVSASIQEELEGERSEAIILETCKCYESYLK